MRPYIFSLVLLGALGATPVRAAERIISLAPNFTEILFALGAGGQVAAVSDYCQYPEEAKQKPRAGGPFNLNFERMVALQPDLVVLPSSLVSVSDKCRALGLEVLALPNEKVGEVIASVERLGEITGKTEEAQGLAETIRARLDKAAEATRELPRKRVLIVVLRAPGGLQDLTAASEDTFLNELLLLAGGKNVVGTMLSRYPRISKENVVELDPEVILDLTFTAKEEDTQAVWSQLPTLTAVRDGAVYALPDPSITIPGPRMVETLERFLKILHPESATHPADPREPQRHF